MNFIVKRMARKGPNRSSCRKQSAQVVLKCCQQGNALTEPDQGRFPSFGRIVAYPSVAYPSVTA